MDKNRILKYIISVLLLILVFSLFLNGCQNNSRVNELEKKITDLQNQISEKESKIKELEKTPVATTIETTTETTVEIKTDEKLVEETINNYISAVENQNFSEQRKYVAKYALDLVNFKEYESKNSSLKDRQFDKQPVSNIKINGNEAEAFMSFTEHNTGMDNSKNDVITEGKVLLEKISNEWKIVDYTRKNRLISEALFNFKDFKITENNIEFDIDYVLFSLSDKYVVVGISIFNGTNKNLQYWSDNAILIGPDKVQSKSQYYDPNLENLLADTIAKGMIQFTWNYDSNNNFSIHTGLIADDQGYTYLNGSKLDIDLSKAIGY